MWLLAGTTHSIACRTPAASFGRTCPGLCPGPVLSAVFPLARLLPSTNSAATGVPASLFVGFLGTMNLSDFPHPFADRVSLLGSGRGPGAISRGGCGISRFPRKECPCVHGVFDRAGFECASRWRLTRCGLPLQRTASAPWMSTFSRLNGQPALPSVNASPSPRGSRRMTRGRSGSLLLLRTALSSATPCRFSSALPTARAPAFSLIPRRQ